MTNISILTYSPGQKATIYLQTLNASGERADALTAPSITRIIFPDLSLAEGFPQYLTKLDTGLYYFTFFLPMNASSVGTYLVDLIFQNPTTLILENTAVQVVCVSPFGTYSVISG